MAAPAATVPATMTMAMLPPTACASATTASTGTSTMRASLRIIT